MNVHQLMNNVVGEVGVFGALALLHDYFGNNPAGYETYPEIQAELVRFEAELMEVIKAVDDPVDREVSEEESGERFLKHEVMPLSMRGLRF